MVSASTKWSLYAGGYAFLCAAVLVRVVAPISTTLMALLNLPESYAGVVLALPVVGIGTAVWWAVIERRNRYTYSLGAAAGLTTALLTVVFWSLAFAVVWDFAILLAGSVLVALVVLIVAPVASVVGVLMMSIRHRLGERLPKESTHAAQ
ncbi:hypothetical protein HWV23_15230 [Natronomonas halophila]|uniref:hypothetical protein n=1 Tax=Natronomonas halophila TaxID=2747817 RepID=UPI0015B7703B|nr:hypothetical protein [Natronomonas halophila]QLD87018.1 hypothetical protein HWV23_15230 [Natronomonas halophila]